MTYNDAVRSLVEAALRVDDFGELRYWATIVEQMTPPKLCECNVLQDTNKGTNGIKWNDYGK